MSDAFDQLADEYEAAVENHIRAAATAFFLRVTRDALQVNEGGSPIRTGRFSESHRISLNSIDSNDGSIGAYNGRAKPISTTLREARAALDGFKLGDTIYVSNSVHYAEKLEEGFSRKTPGGVYGPTTLWFERTIRNGLKHDGAKLYDVGRV